jgi:predicted  nucleic acid-binding Zn-ribbon protein
MAAQRARQTNAILAQNRIAAKGWLIEVISKQFHQTTSSSIIVSTEPAGDDPRQGGIMPPVALLGQLNEIDLAIDALRARAAEIAEALKEPAALQAARTTVAAADTELARCKMIQSERESAQQKAAAKLTQAEGRLYGGKVRNPKELEDSEKDVAQLRRQHAQAEDALLEALIASEAAAEVVAGAQHELEQRSTEWNATQAGLRAEHARLTERLTTERARQAAARRAVPTGILHIYDTLRPRRAGRAVARLDGDTCAVCLVAVSPSRLAAARDGDELAYCENCGRILWTE